MIGELLKRLIDILGPIVTLSKDRRELKDMALRTISNALNETYLYYEYLEKGGVRNPEREELLVKCWSAAAIPIRHFDPQLSIICDIKAEYWINPENYTNEDVDDLGIRLSDVRNAYKQLLWPGSHKSFRSR